VLCDWDGTQNDLQATFNLATSRAAVAAKRRTPHAAIQGRCSRGHCQALMTIVAQPSAAQHGSFILFPSHPARVQQDQSSFPMYRPGRR
jgi:hypothetical protein